MTGIRREDDIGMDAGESRQAAGALARANAVRFARAEDKRRIKRGALDPAGVLLDPPDHWRAARVIDLLLAIDRVGRERASRWLVTAGHVSPTRHIGELTERQRVVLARSIGVFVSRRRDADDDRDAPTA